MKFTKLLIATALLCSFTAPLYANEMTMNVDQKVAKMKTDLNLTEDQANQVKPIIQDYKDKMAQIHQEKENKLSQILSSAQMQQLKSMKKDKDMEPASTTY